MCVHCTRTECTVYSYQHCLFETLVYVTILVAITCNLCTLTEFNARQDSTTIEPYCYYVLNRFGRSVGEGLLSALLCWPSPWVVLIGALASSVGAALQCLTSMYFTQSPDTRDVKRDRNLETESKAETKR